MYLCKVCGGNIVFDIKTQQLVCPYCGDTEDPYAREGDPKEMAKQEEFEVNVFSCPYCGGEIMSQDNEAASFCSFCGTSTTLNGRLSKEKRPKFIIPFKKTKDDCKAIYLKKLNSSPYAPNELKDERAIDSFRGIYMPYWSYHLTQDSPFSLVGTVKRKSGDKTVTEYYEVDGNVKGYYKGLSYDSSTSFEDDVSESIAPYYVKDMKYFTPSYLSGFYADMEDVPSTVYNQDVVEITNEETIRRLKNDPDFRKKGRSDMKISSSENIIPTNIKNADNVMYPVWFMSYQKGDRVAYSTINGQTGKFAMDIPIDMKKYLLYTTIASIPIFIVLLLSMFAMSLQQTFYSFLLIVFSYLITFIHSSQLFNVINQHNNFSDKGSLYKETKNNFVMRKTKGGWLKVVYMVGIFAALGIIFSEDVEITTIAIFVPLIATIVQFISICTMYKNRKLSGEKFSLMGDTFIVLFTLVMAILMGFESIPIIHPLLNTIMAGSCALTLINIIKRYNLYSTRKLPQFNKTGGDNRA